MIINALAVEKYDQQQQTSLNRSSKSSARKEKYIQSDSISFYC